MSWQIDPLATRTAAEVFKPYRPIVRRNGRQYVIDASAYGKVELIPLPAGRFLAAAESPPQALPDVERARLERDLLGHLQRNHVHPWKIVPGSDAAEALRHLRRPDSDHEARPDLLTWLPYACKLTRRGELIGQDRLPVVEHLAGTVKAHRGDDPLSTLVGPPGVGKRTVLLAVAETLGLSAVELPLRRILTNRTLQTPMECFLDTVLTAARQMGENDLLAVSDADLTTQLPPGLSRHALLELSRLPNVVLLSNSESWVVKNAAGLAPIICPGLADTKEATELLARDELSLDFVGPALSMICRAADLPDVGIVPGRLLYLARLARSLTGGGDRLPSQPLSPDEVAPAIRIGQEAWKEQNP